MSIERTLALVRYALVFAACVSAVYALIRLSRLKLHIDRPGREAALFAAVFYLAALLYVTAIRGGLSLNPGGAVNWIPGKMTVGQFRAGAWPFAYHFLGNTLWFMPLGFLLPALFRGWTLPRAALLGLAVSVGIEVAQWLFRTGSADIDDVLLNTAGTALGYAAHALLRRRRDSV
ncbi:MAG: VanZ family protein [Clostridiales bacterium]|nr:VanZ family protein [Clostridiales bacterium]